MKTTLLTFLILYLFLSCSVNSERTVQSNSYTIKQLNYDDFPKQRNLLGQKLDIPQIVYPRRIMALKDYLIVTETKADTLIHALDKKNFQYIRQLGINGFGPGEIQSPWALLEDPIENSFWAQQLSNKQLSKFDLSNSSVYSISNYRQEGDLLMAVNIVWISDSTLIGTRADGMDKFVEYDKTGVILNSYGTWEGMLEREYPSSVISSLHQGRLITSKDRSKVLLACLDRDIVEILDKDNGKILSIRGPLNHTPKFNVDNSPGYPMIALDRNTIRYCYVGASFGEKFIYLLYSGHSYLTVDVNKNKFCEQIFVLDFDGVVLDHFFLDTSIKEFAVDEMERKFYGITIDSEPNVIVFGF